MTAKDYGGNLDSLRHGPLHLRHFTMCSPTSEAQLSIEDWGGIRTVRLGDQVLTQDMTSQLPVVDFSECPLWHEGVETIGRVSIPRILDMNRWLGDEEEPSNKAVGTIVRNGDNWEETLTGEPEWEVLIRFGMYPPLAVWRVPHYCWYRDFYGDEDHAFLREAERLPLVLLP